MRSVGVNGVLGDVGITEENIKKTKKIHTKNFSSELLIVIMRTAIRMQCSQKELLNVTGHTCYIDFQKHY